MKRPQITPGQWREYNLTKGRILKNWSVCDSRGCRIAKIEEMPGQCSAEEHANARAIAALPALLEALESMLEAYAPFHQKSVDHKGGEEGLHSAVRKTRAALTLAGYEF